MKFAMSMLCMLTVTSVFAAQPIILARVDHNATIETLATDDGRFCVVRRDAQGELERKLCMNQIDVNSEKPQIIDIIFSEVGSKTCATKIRFRNGFFGYSESILGKICW